MAIKIFNYSDSFQVILLVSIYVSIGILSYYNSKLLRDSSKLKKLGLFNCAHFKAVCILAQKMARVTNIKILITQKVLKLS